MVNNEQEWHHDTAVVVIGSGGASALSGGVVYAGGGTVIQQQAGEQDSVENMVNYLKQEVGDVVSAKTLQSFCEQSSDNIDWLMAQGVPFDATTYAEKTSYPPEGYFLYYSGNEICAPFKQHAMPARRGHRTKGKSFTGKVLYQSLRDKVDSTANITQINFANVSKLISNKEGKIVGVAYQKIVNNGTLLARAQTTLAKSMTLLKPSIGIKIRRSIVNKQAKQAVETIRASSGVIIASGGFMFNREMVKRHAPLYRHCQPVGENCDGRGIELGQQHGGATKYMNNISAWRFISPPTAMVKGVLVDNEGKRIINEDLYGAKTAEHMVEKNQGKGLLIVDSRLLAEIKSQARPGKIAWHQWIPNRMLLSMCSKRSDSIEGLASACNLPPEALKKTLEKYNEDVLVKHDQFGKAEGYLQPLLQPPFYAIDISINNPVVPCPALTLGGLQVNETSGQVLNENGQDIDGLYAIGRAAVGICSNSYVSGLSLADCVFSGRRAAKALG